jgi:hypothetical protein
MPAPARRLYVLVTQRHLSVRRPVEALRYLHQGREVDNFTYPISNREELVDFVSGVTQTTRIRISALFAELEGDSTLLSQLREGLKTRKDRSSEPHYGRRIVWYALARLLRPRLIVETGVHDGLGSAVLLRAIDQNGVGRLLGMDIRPDSGWLIPFELRDRFDFKLGPSLASIAALDRPVNMFVADSDHRPEYESAEYEAVLPQLASGAVLISDTAWYGDELKNFAEVHHRQFSYCREVSRNHWYPGAGVGISLPVANDAVD